MSVVVTGIGLVSVLGELEDTWNHLLAGGCGIKVHRPFSELEPLPLALIQDVPIASVELTHRVVTAALKDARLSPPLPDCGVVIGSSRGNQGQWEKLAREMLQETGADQENRGVGENTRHIFCALPSRIVLSDWLGTLPHAAAIATARYIQTTAPVLAPMAACATGLWAIAQGYELIRMGQCQRVLAGAVEAPITPLTLTGFQRMGALAQTGAYPFDQNREGLVLGEGGAILVLEAEELAESRGAKVYGRILGFGLTADGYHVSAPEPGSWGAIAAIKHCLERSQLSPDQIDYIHAHGTATHLNDQNEANLLQYLFPGGVAVSSTKGATGHTMGASGALGVAFCLMALKHQILPPCIGLRQPAFDLNYVTHAYSARIHSALCLSFGFGGQNGAIALERPREWMIGTLKEG
ncbi:beta-ketoacyl-ACP synthase [Leptothermofonsia sp. ETS-13]|uniref:beta-ketoacyl-ACP synthase n=1 Tax=Leptothermofonsia sp. ETS-13 TaxID=3035696 RepID=UPI003B9FE712